jgi:hypothetical protein
MQWSQLKKQIEDRLAPALQKRVRFYNAVYRASHDGEGRGWMTIDGRQVLDAASYSAWTAERLDSDPQFQRWRTPASKDAQSTWTTADAERRRQAVAERAGSGLYTKQEFNGLLWHYLQLSLDAAVSSPIMLHRALAYLDRRLGRRRFVTWTAAAAIHPLENACRALRASVEGWPLEEVPISPSGLED